MALKRSPFDTAGFSQTRQTRGSLGLGTAGGGTTSTIVFHRSTFSSPGSVEMDGATEGMLAGDRLGTYALEPKASRQSLAY